MCKGKRGFWFHEMNRVHGEKCPLWNNPAWRGPFQQSWLSYVGGSGPYLKQTWWLGTGLAARQKSPVRPVRSNLHARMRATKFCPPQRPLLLQANLGWVPVKARRLQDWEKLKKYVLIHKHGDVCPNGVPAHVEGGNNEDDSDSE